MTKLNRKAFFDALRGSVMFPRGFTEAQVAGMNNLLDVWEGHFATDSDFDLAYNLGTAFHETAATMQPITERGAKSYFNKYEPGTEIGKRLGNTQPGDGYKFRGEGHVQNTGRRNAAFATKRLNETFKLGIDLVANPDKRGDPFISAMSLFLGNKEGWWTGKKLRDYIDGIPEGDKADTEEFAGARRVVNGTDKASTIAAYAMSFYKALGVARKAAPAPAPVQVQTPAPAPVPTPAAPVQEPASTLEAANAAPTGGWAALIAAIVKLFGGSK